MRLRLDWLRALHDAVLGPAREQVQPRPLYLGIGYCPGCDGLRASNSLSCNHCGSAAPVTADA
jgi:hypothetical protein